MYIEPLRDLSNNLAPTNEFEVEIIKTLTGKNSITPHKMSDIIALKLNLRVKKDSRLAFHMGFMKFSIELI